jgi:hypothetical protein
MTDDLIKRAKAALEGATPGPWKLGVDVDTYAGGDATDASISVGRDDFDPVALAINEHPEEDCRKSDGTLESNARLIALAPDLARALIREREAADELLDALKLIDSISVHSGGEIHGVQSSHWRDAFIEAQQASADALAAYRAAREGGE